jgi:RNA polymerase-binding transcription factor DksA
MGDFEKDVFITRLKSKSNTDLEWMKERIEIELGERDYDEIKDKEFRVCDNCGHTWPEAVHYCRCGYDKMMRCEKVMIWRK